MSYVTNKYEVLVDFSDCSLSY